MLTLLLKYWVRLGLPFFARSLIISGRQQLACNGPLLLAVNHPNSFLDAILLGAYMHHPVFYLTRGDVFRKKWIRRLLTHLNMLPVYRIRDGKDKLSLNDQTFERSRQVLTDNGILLVFVEGFCEHQTTLQLPLKKGAPRVVEACWRQGKPVQILPVWLQYHSFTDHPKNISMHFGSLIGKPEEMEKMETPIVWQQINEQTALALKTLEQKAFTIKWMQTSSGLKLLLHLPAILGAVLHAPLYLPLKAIIKKINGANVHYDSALFATLLLLYPLYLIFLGFLLALATSAIWFLFPLVVLPVLARCYVLWK